jgi:colanic acid biosynthesis glycosyl transferase WcaI
VVTNPPTLPFVALFVCRLRRAKLILRIEDIYPDAMVAAGMVGKNSVVVRLLNVLHRSLYRNADRVIVLGRDMQRLVQQKLQYHPRQITIITNWADCDEILPLEKNGNPLLLKLGLESKFVVQYSGNMGRTHDLAGLVQCARILEREQAIHFLFIGAGAKEAWLRRTVRELDLRNVTLLPAEPRESLAQSLNACDLAVIAFVCGMAGISVPSRMYNILAAGKPILAIADADSELAQVIEEARVGWHVDPGVPEKAARTILDAATNRDSLSEMSKRARALVLKQYTKSQIIGRFEELLAGLSSSSNDRAEGSS